MLLYIEGIDRSGKTTFINKISDELKIDTYRKHVPKNLTPQYYHSHFKGVGYAVVELASLTSMNLIVDRSFISDWVYSRRDNLGYGFENWKEWEQHHLTKNVIAVICYISIGKETFLKRIAETPDEFMEYNEYDLFCDAYEEYFSKSGLKVVRISGEDDYEVQKKLFLTCASSNTIPKT